MGLRRERFFPQIKERSEIEGPKSAEECGELIGRPFLHQVIRDGKDVVLGTVGGAA
jgi:hypothetical protein